MLLRRAVASIINLIYHSCRVMSLGSAAAVLCLEPVADTESRRPWHYSSPQYADPISVRFFSRISTTVCIRACLLVLMSADERTRKSLDGPGLAMARYPLKFLALPCQGKT